MEIRVEEDNITELHDASEKGCTVTLHRLIQIDPHILNKISLTSFNETPLHISAMLGHIDFTRALLALKPQLAMDLEFHKRCPLHLASANGHLEIVHALIHANEDACLVCDQDGRTPLYYAAMRGKYEVVRALIFAKPDSTRVVFNAGETVLHLCVKYNQLETLKLLVELVRDDGEFLNSKDHDGGDTILHLAVMLKQIEMEVTQKIYVDGEVNRRRCMSQNPIVVGAKTSGCDVYVFDCSKQLEKQQGGDCDTLFMGLVNVSHMLMKCWWKMYPGIQRMKICLGLWGTIVI